MSTFSSTPFAVNGSFGSQGTNSFSFGNASAPTSSTTFGGMGSSGMGSSLGSGLGTSFGSNTSSQPSFSFSSSTFGSGIGGSNTGLGSSMGSSGMSTSGGMGSGGLGFGFGTGATTSGFGTTSSAPTSGFGTTGSGASSGFGTTGMGLGGTSTGFGNSFGSSPSPFNTSTNTIGSSFGMNNPASPSTNNSFGSFSGLNSSAPTSLGGGLSSGLGSGLGTSFGTSFGAQPTVVGTGNPPYQSVDEGADKFTHICVMKDYQVKSIDELRWEDYKKAKQSGGFPQTTGTNMGSAFGLSNTQPSTTFGSTNLTNPTSSSGWLNTSGNNFSTSFSSPAKTATTTASTFGTGTSGSAFSFGSGFGGQAPSTTTAPSTFSFPSSQPSTTTTTNPSVFSFGANTGSSFSTTSTDANKSFSFGNTTTNPTPASSFSFGNTPSATTTSAPTSTFNFGSTNTQPTSTSSFSFGNTPSATNTQPSFNPQPSSTFSFNAPSSTSTTTQPTNTFSFGPTNSQPTSFFNNMSTNPQVNPTAPTNALEATVTSQPYGVLPLLFDNPGNIGPYTTQPPPTFSTPGPLRPKRVCSTPFFKVTPKSNNTLSIRGMSSTIKNVDDQIPENMFIPKTNIKKLDLMSATPEPSPLFDRKKRLALLKTPSRQTEQTQNTPQSIMNTSTPATSVKKPFPLRPSGGPSYLSSISSKFDKDEISSAYDQLPRLTKENYYTIPSMDVLSSMSIDELRNVQEFVVGHREYGEILFPGVTDVRNLDLDTIIQFNRKTVTTYPNEEEKPEAGKGLNKRAIITIFNCWPDELNTQASRLSSPGKLRDFEKKLRTRTERFKGKFVDYNTEIGSWSFEVEHL